MLSNIFYFQPKPWGNDPIWRPYFSDRWFKKSPPIHRQVFPSFLTPNPATSNQPFVFGSSDPQCRRFQREKTSKQIRPKNLHERGEGFGDGLGPILWNLPINLRPLSSWDCQLQALIYSRNFCMTWCRTWDWWMGRWNLRGSKLSVNWWFFDWFALCTKNCAAFSLAIES